MKAVSINSLTKIFKTKSGHENITALDNFTLSVESGTVFGLLGPNGAGKTTLIKVLLGITFPTAGGATVLNSSISNYKIRSKIGYLPENHKFPNYLTAEQVLKYFSDLSGYQNKRLNYRIEELLSLVRMSKWKNTKIKKFSKGMMQRLGLAQAMIHNPAIIFLDEPTDGVDPIGRKEIRDILLDLKAKGKTIFLNSHLLSEVELVSDRVAIMNKGRLIREGNVKEMTTSLESYIIETTTKFSAQFVRENLAQFNITKSEEDKLSVNFKENEELNELIDVLRKSRINIRSVVVEKNSLEDLFISLITESNGRIK